jgi:hypothetical protein
MDNLQFVNGEALAEFCFSANPVTPIIVGVKGNSLIVDLTPQNVVKLRDWLTTRIDWLKDKGELPESVTSSL